MKGSEKVDKYMDIVTKLWNKTLTMIPTVVDALGTIHKGLEKRLVEQKIRTRIETIQTTALLRIEYIEESKRLDEVSVIQSPPVKTDVKNSQRVK